MKSPKVIFFGNERLATGVTTTAPTLQALIDNGYQIEVVILNNETAVSRKNRPLEIAELAQKHDIPVAYPSNLKEHLDKLAGHQADVGVLVAYGKIVPQEVIDLFPAGIVNIHPSLLPRHRGPTPLESVILNGEDQTGVSLMKLAKKMDSGPVYVQRTTPVPGKISKQKLADVLLKIGSDMLVQHLPDIISGSLNLSPQDDTQATYDSMLSKTNSPLDWAKPAAVLERQIRAYAEWPKSTAVIGPYNVIINQADVIKTSGKPGDYKIDGQELIIFCGQDALKITTIQPVNKKEMPVKAFLAGYRL
jgi:methionyl-tRNA formyltransferase